MSSTNIPPSRRHDESRPCGFWRSGFTPGQTTLRRFAVKWTTVVAWIAFGLCLAVAESVVACPNCKDSLSQNDPTAMGIVQGFFWSIILMLSLPFIVLVGLSTYFYVLVRRARRAAEAAAGSSSNGNAADPLEAVLANSRLPRWSPTLDS